MTRIEWTDKSINPLRAMDAEGNDGHYCEKLSPGCANCYASNLQKRFKMPAFPGHGKPNKDVNAYLDRSKLLQVINRQKPTKWFWFDMTDCFGWWVHREWLDDCFATMLLTPWHEHQVLTKRPDRMLEYFNSNWTTRLLNSNFRKEQRDRIVNRWPARVDSIQTAAELLVEVAHLENLWLGVSVENQEQARIRIPLLSSTNVPSVRFLSCEPLLGPLDLDPYLHAIDWVIVGAESGPKRRELELPWIDDIRESCETYDTALFIKQLGKSLWIPNDTFERWPHFGEGLAVSDNQPRQGELCRVRLNARKGADPNEWPADLRIRQFPGEAVECR